MIIREDKNKARKQRAKRTSDIHGTAVRPRLSVYRSTSEIYAQIINDDTGETLVAVNSLQKEMAKKLEGKTKKEQSFIIGQEAGKLALAKKIKEVVFDRNGYVYEGRIAQVAEGAREVGLKF
ncbi:MAG: 50S ribosomal protein L18 [Firmicutes bacterium]|nr:50S ribosomal protein L18 [Bacillota bacterium]